MGWHFRKTKKVGIFRTTISKKGIGTSVGIPGLRFGVSPDGRNYFSLGIPGTGLYYIKYLGKNTPIINIVQKNVKVNKVKSITDKF